MNIKTKIFLLAGSMVLQGCQKQPAVDNAATVPKPAAEPAYVADFSCSDETIIGIPGFRLGTRLSDQHKVEGFAKYYADDDFTDAPPFEALIVYVDSKRLIYSITLFTADHHASFDAQKEVCSILSKKYGKPHMFRRNGDRVLKYMSPHRYVELVCSLDTILNDYKMTLTYCDVKLSDAADDASKRKVVIKPGEF